MGTNKLRSRCAQYWDTCEYQDGVLNYNQDTHRQRTVNWCDTTGGTAAAFDFTTKGALACFTALDPCKQLTCPGHMHACVAAAAAPSLGLAVAHSGA